MLAGGGSGKHKHMRLEHLLRSWSNPVAQMFAEASPVQVVHHLHLGIAHLLTLYALNERPSSSKVQ